MLSRQNGGRIDFLDVSEVLEDPSTGDSNSGFLIYIYTKFVSKDSRSHPELSLLKRVYTEVI